MNLLEGTKTGDPLTSPFPIRSSACSLGSEAHPAVSSPLERGLSSSEEVQKKQQQEKHTLLHKHCLHKHVMNERTEFVQSAQK